MPPQRLLEVHDIVIGDDPAASCSEGVQDRAAGSLRFPFQIIDGDHGSVIRVAHVDVGLDELRRPVPVTEVQQLARLADVAASLQVGYGRSRAASTDLEDAQRQVK